jgi:hypothetical protein
MNDSYAKYNKVLFVVATAAWNNACPKSKIYYEQNKSTKGMIGFKTYHVFFFIKSATFVS